MITSDSKSMLAPPVAAIVCTLSDLKCERPKAIATQLARIHAPIISAFSQLLFFPASILFPPCQTTPALNCLDSLLGTLCDAGSAVCTLGLIDHSHIVLYSDGAGRTVLFTDVAGNTSDRAILVNILTHIL